MKFLSAVILGSMVLADFTLPVAVFGQKSEIAVAGADRVVEAISYRPDSKDAYVDRQCRIDLYVPGDKNDFATVIWFHGGGLTGGRRVIPEALKRQGFAVVGVGYRFGPPAPFPCFLDDAAAAAAWVFKSISSYGGDPNKVFIAGHSAGAYLAFMVGADPRWLNEAGFSSPRFAGVIAVSAQMTTHFQVRKLRGDRTSPLVPVIDEYAPLHYASAGLPPICLVVGDSEREWPSRVEENALMAVTLRNLKHPRVTYQQVQGIDHNGMAEAGLPWLTRFVHEVLDSDRAKPPASP